MEAYRDFQREGDAYLKTARGAGKRPRIFTPTIVYGILSLAIEKHLMAILLQVDQLPDNHTFRDLVAAMETVSPLEPDLTRFLLDLDAFDDLCSLDTRRTPVPDEAMVTRMLDAAGAIQDHADAILGPLGVGELAMA